MLTLLVELTFKSFSYWVVVAITRDFSVDTK